MGGARALTETDYARELVRAGAVELRPDPKDWFVWTSGTRAPIYCDNRLLISDPRARGVVADGLAGAIRRRFPAAEVIAGTATAGIPHAAWVAERLDLPMVYVRSSAKGHGTRKQVEGRALRGERVVLVEDLISTGGSALAAVEALQAEGGKVLGVQAIFTYGLEKAERAFERAGLAWQALTSYAALLETLELDEASRQLLRDWRID